MKYPDMKYPDMKYGRQRDFNSFVMNHIGYVMKVNGFGYYLLLDCKVIENGYRLKLHLRNIETGYIFNFKIGSWCNVEIIGKHSEKFEKNLLARTKLM
jgi:hypothetical protein